MATQGDIDFGLVAAMRAILLRLSSAQLLLRRSLVG